MSQKVTKSGITLRREQRTSPRTAPRSSAYPASLSIVQRRNHIRIAPETDLAPSGLKLSVGIPDSVRGGLLPMILLVVPRHADFDLLKVDVLAVHDALAEPPVPI